MAGKHKSQCIRPWFVSTPSRQWNCTGMVFWSTFNCVTWWHLLIWFINPFCCRFTSDHNNKVAMLLIDALSLREYSRADALTLTKRNYRRVKEANRRKTETEIKRAKIHVKKKQVTNTLLGKTWMIELSHQKVFFTHWLMPLVWSCTRS